MHTETKSQILEEVETKAQNTVLKDLFCKHLL